MPTADEPHRTFSLAGNEWPLTEAVKAYLEWVAIDVNDLRKGHLHEHLYWDDGVLYFARPEEADDDPRVLTPGKVRDTLFDDLDDEQLWGLVVGCDLTTWVPKDVEPDEETIAATRHRITELAVWRLVSSREFPEELREFSRDVLSEYSEDDWTAAVDDDPNLAIAKDELGL